MKVSPGKAIYISIVVAGISALALGGLGLARVAGNIQSTENHEICDGNVLAQESLLDILQEFDVGDEAAIEIESVIGQLDEVMDLEANGNRRRASVLEEQIFDKLDGLSASVLANGNAELSDALLNASEAVRGCIQRPEPAPGHAPEIGFVYSVKFVCGRDIRRGPASASGFDEQPFEFNRDVYRTEINVHNFNPRRVRAVGRALVANPVNAPRGPVSARMAKELRPNEAFQMNCRNIRQMFGGDHPPEVCPGKIRALEILVRVHRSDLGSEDTFSERIAETIEILEQSVRLEKEGALEESAELNLEALEHLSELVEIANDLGNDRLANALSEAAELLRRCAIRAEQGDVVDDAEPTRPDILAAPQIIEGFLTIHTPVEIEVTAVYRAQSDNKTQAGGAGSGTSIDVEQIRPHRVRRPINEPVVDTTP